MWTNITKIALKGVALAMRVAVIVLSTLNALDIWISVQPSPCSALGWLRWHSPVFKNSGWPGKSTALGAVDSILLGW
jgi:hypothetical protein